MDAKSDHKPFRRVEDDALVSGRGRFLDDGEKDGVAFAAFVRSPHAHARIVSVNGDAARQAPGMIAVLTAEDITKAGIGNTSHAAPLKGRGDKPFVMSHRPALAGERVMHVGEPVALVVATSVLAAQDAAEKVAIEYQELDAIIDAREADRPGAQQIFPDVPGNLAIDWPGLMTDESNAQDIDRIISAARHVARLTVPQQRLVVASMEMRGATASYDKAADRFTLRVCTQSAGAMQAYLLGIMKLPKEKLRVVTEDVGGAFGMKSGSYPEYVALLVAARMLGRPIHWMSSRSEAFVSDNQGRDAISEAELALDERGKFLALRVRHLQNLGAFVTSAGIVLATINFARCFPTVYRIPRMDITARCVYTNTVPTGAYRGAGRPEANYIMERLVDEAARVTGLDRATLRRRNLIPASAMPYKTALNVTFDSGEFPAILDKALKLAGYGEFKRRRREAKKRGKLRGLGISCFLEHSGGYPTEGALLAFPGDGTLTLALQVQSTGQAHATVFPKLVAGRLGIPAEQIKHRHGDSDFDLKGFPSVASRSAMTAGNAAMRAVEVMLEKGKKIAASVLEAAEGDITYRNGAFEVVGTDRRIALFDLARRAAEMKSRGEIPESLDTKVAPDTPLTFPNGCHVAEIEIDPETGMAEVVAYTAVDDCGNVLDHTIVEGQVHGGLAQGLGQVLLENAVYDSGSGQLVTGSFMDYAMPRAQHMPSDLRDALHPVPATTNPLGVKGVGEAGTTASLAAIMNAIADAIPNGAGARIEMPATTEKIWKACNKAVVP